MANRIRELRKQKNLTMKQLGEHLGMAENVVSRYETGKRQPDNEALVKFANFFNVSVGYLIGAEEPGGLPQTTRCVQESAPQYTDDEIRVIEIYRSLSQQGKEYILSQLNIATQVYTKNASVPVAGTEAG